MKGQSTAVLTLFLAATQLASLAAVRPDGFRPPTNLQVDGLLKPLVERMWQASPTFRRQCRRLAAENSLQVTVVREDQPSVAAFANARTALTFKGNTPVAARVYIKNTSNGAELVAHELEHILEQLDGVDLQAQTGNGAVWKGDRSSFETRRAIEAGRRVAREVSNATAANDSSRSSGADLDAPVTLKLQDRNATPVSARTARLSGGGRYVVFTSPASLVAEDRNQLRDVYVTDFTNGRTTLESTGPAGAAADGDSVRADISADGRYVVFESEAGNLIGTAFPAGSAQIYLRDRRDQTTRLLTTGAGNQQANGPSWNPVISADGTAVAFESAATDLIATARDERQGAVGVYLISLSTGVRIRLDARTAQQPGLPGSSMSPAISADGRYVVFASKADLTCQDSSGCSDEPGDHNRLTDVYLFDTSSQLTKRVSRSLAGGDPDGASYDPALSGDGRFVVFVSEASNLTRQATGRRPQIYLQELASGRVELVSRTSSGSAANGSSLRPALSFDGSVIAFQSLATNLLCEGKCPSSLEDINLLWDVFVHDRATNRTARMSGDGGDEWMETSRCPSIDGAGRMVAFGSWHPIGIGDAAHDEDLFIVRYPRSSVSTAAIVPGLPKR